MKNLVLLFAAVVAVSFASCGCGNSTETTEETVDSSMVVVETPDSIVADTAAVDTVAAL